MNNKALKLIFEKHKQELFPAYSKPASLADWVADLAELDGYFAGIAESLIAGNEAKLTVKSEKNLKKMHKTLDQICKKYKVSKDAADCCATYLTSLEALNQAIKKVVDRENA